ncbi:cupin domain-containing protein [Evansella sp. AB-P1]|uniref:cupin domain-containing protein n=1 Tax=Evansella sp. AB-P1 TaxID=3037653 RepID=UPI00241E6DC8|nr:cupin domain-containing protein [Evansella sp. AB-P1]MDG5787183.1 cupin domain-containing protein [Evansella sp. AB-P1]
MEKKSIKEYINYNEKQFAKRIIFKDEVNTAFTLNFLPGQSLPAHKHPGATVYIYVMDGIGEFSIDGEKVPVKKDDVLFSEGHEEMAFFNSSSENVNLYVILSKIPDERYAKDI